MSARPDSGYCSKCAQVSLLTRGGLCAWCDHPVAPRAAKTPPATRPKAGANANRGVPVLMGDDVLEHARDLYATGKSLRAVARELLSTTGYSSEKSFVMALSAQFRHRGWPLRGRIEQVVMAQTVHGLARRGNVDPGYRAAQRRKRGEVRGVMCSGVRTHYPRKGEPCQRPARAGSHYCASHDPALAAARDANLREARSRIGAQA